jgi:sulfatase modifying factor 1
VQARDFFERFALGATLAACSSPTRPPVDPSPNETNGSESDGGAGRIVTVPDASADANAVPLSCRAWGGDLTECGATHDSCCTSLEVDGGTYYRSYVNDNGTGAEGKHDPATVSAFRLDKYDVTVGRFRPFVGAVLDSASPWTPPVGAGKHAHLYNGLGLVSSGTFDNESGWVSSYNVNIAPTDANLACVEGNSPTWPLGNDDLPINCLNWYEAYAFCIWDGGFLPSEAESEFAAAGGVEERPYPWGSTDPGPGTGYAVYDDVDGGTPGLPHPTIAPVGTSTLGAGRWGQLDLAGNVSVWNLDWDLFPSYPNPCIDCACLTPATGRIARGGAFSNDASYLHPSKRRSGGLAPTGRFPDVGVRCARVP